MAAAFAIASPESVRKDIADRLQQVPDLAAADDTVADAPAIIAAGQRLWTAKFKKGGSMAGCFPNGGRRVTANYPQYDARLKRVVTLEMAINQCRKSHGEALYEPSDAATMGAVTAYVRSLSNGMKMSVRVPAAGEDRFESGRRMYFTRMGQRNFACASCHVQGAGKHFDGVALSPAIGQATHWPEIRDGAPVTLQVRVRECMELMGAAPFPAGSDELNDVEYFLSYLSNGQPLKANVLRTKAP
jgi:sulfur-oxidizing protein SoxA